MGIAWESEPSGELFSGVGSAGASPSRGDFCLHDGRKEVILVTNDQ